jgi:hypothetical protein
MYAKAKRAALGCLASSPYRRVAVADVRRVPEEGYVLMTNIYDISKAEFLGPGTRIVHTWVARRRQKEHPIRDREYTFISNPTRKRQYEIPARTVADENYAWAKSRSD